MALPGASGEQHQNGENFQTACQHTEGQQQLTEAAVSAKVAGGADSVQAGADVIEGGQGGGQVGLYGEAVQGQQSEDQNHNHHIGGKIGVGVA